MVTFTSSLFLLANVFTICNALPTPYSSRSLEARRPAFGQTITMSKTVNNAAAGTFTATGGDVTFTVGEKLGGGSVGEVFSVNCGANAACTALGPVVLKFYTKLAAADLEQKHLAKIDELKAVSTGTGDKLALMKGFPGKNLSQTDAYLALTEKVTDKTKLDIPKIKTLVEGAAALAVQSGLEYLNQHGIAHEDINDGNVLFTESGGRITAAHLIDWDQAHIATDAELAGLRDFIRGQTNAFERFVDNPAKAKSDADKAALPKKPVPGPGAPAAAPGSVKPAPPKACAAAPRPARPAAAAPRPVTRPPAPPASGGLPAAPPANQKP